MKSYSFLTELKCDENDLEFLFSYLNNAKEEIDKTDGAGELDMVIDKICNDLKKSISKEKLEDYQEATQKFRKQIVNTLICHLQHLKIMGSVNGCGAGSDEFKLVLSTDYIKTLVDLLDRKGLLCESVSNRDPIFTEDDWKFIEEDLLMYRMRIQKCINTVEIVDELRKIESALYDKIRDHSESVKGGRAMHNVNAALAHRLTCYRNQLIKDDSYGPRKDEILRTLSMLGLMELNDRYGNDDIEILTLIPQKDCNQKMVAIKQFNPDPNRDPPVSVEDVVSAYESFLDVLRDFNGIYVQSRKTKDFLRDIGRNCFWCGFQLDDQFELSKIARAFDNRYCLGNGEFIDAYDDLMWRINTTSSDYCPRGRNPLVWFDIVTVRPFINNKEAKAWLLQATQSMIQWQDPKHDRYFRSGGHEDDNVTD